MITITKERAQEIFLGNGPEPTASEERELARIALASLEAEPVAGEARFKEERYWSPCTAAHVAMVLANPSDWPNYEVRYLYINPPAPVADEDLLHMAASAIEDLLSNRDRSGAGVWADIPGKLRRAAMLNQEKSNG